MNSAFDHLWAVMECVYRLYSPAPNGQVIINMGKYIKDGDVTEKIIYSANTKVYIYFTPIINYTHTNITDSTFNMFQD